MNVAPSGVRSMLNAATLLPTSDAARSGILLLTRPVEDTVFIVTLPDFHSGSPICTFGAGSLVAGALKPVPGMVNVMVEPVVGSARG